jgi:Protein of unknown function (DUF1552)
MKTPFYLGRRQFLRGTAGATLAIPALPSLAHAGAQVATPSKKFISFRVTNGYYGSFWYPSEATLRKTGKLVALAPNVRRLSLTEIPGPISPLLDASFDPVRSKIALLRHIDKLDSANHAPTSGLMGWSFKGALPNDLRGLPPSIDKLMAARVFGGAVSPLNLAIANASTGPSCSTSAAESGEILLEAGLYPHQAFEKLFGARLAEPTVVAKRLRHKQALVDRVLPHYREVASNPRLSIADRQYLERHVDHIRDLQSRLNRQIVECTPPQSPEVFGRTPESIDAAGAAHIDLTIAALRCGLTNIVNLYFDPDNLLTGPLHGVENGHHAASHDPGAVVAVFNALKWSTRHLSMLLLRLDAERDGNTGKSMLDTSLVFFNNEIGNQHGQSGLRLTGDINHHGLDAQVLLAGNCDGVLRMGDFLDFGTEYRRPRYTPQIGTAYNRVLVTCMLAMGLSPQDWEQNGQPGYCDLRGVDPLLSPPGKTELGDLRAMLPGLGA